MTAQRHNRLNSVDCPPEHPARLNASIAQLATVLIGKEHQIRLALACLIANGHLLIEDVPGVGKTTLAQALGATLGLPRRRIQFTADLLPADITGVTIFDANTQSFTFKPGPVFTSVLLADEINRAPPRAQSALLEAMQERQVTVDGETHELEDSFFVIATQNPTDQMGVYPLPESQLDRFLVGLSLGYPDAESERELLRSGDRRENIAALTPVVERSDLRHWREQAANLTVSEPLLDYVQALVGASRQLNSVSAGLSPRAALGLLAVARAWALLHGQDFILPEDIQTVFPAVAGHRLTGSVSQGGELCRQLLNSVAVG